MIKLGLFGNNNRAFDDTKKIKDWVQNHFRLDEDSTVMVTQLQCKEEGCPPVETVIAILKEKNNKQYKLYKSAVEVTESDIIDLLNNLDKHAHDHDH